MSEDIKNDISSLKDKMGCIENDFDEKLRELDEKELKWQKEDERVAEMLKKSDVQIVRFYVGGVKFATRLETIAKRKDHLLYKMVCCPEINLKDHINLDRDPNYFRDILDFLRHGLVNLKKYTHREIEALRDEADFFELTDLIAYVDDEALPGRIITYEINNEKILSVPKDVSSLDSPSVNNAFLCNPGGHIIFEFGKIVDATGLEIKGYDKSPNEWLADSGVNANIHYSLDGTSWVDTTSLIPYYFGTQIQTVKFNFKLKMRYIKFSGSYLSIGISYLKLLQ
jgi:hypothetical protein